MSYLHLTALLLIAGLAAGCTETEAPASPPPNILFILVDDLGYGDLSATGSTYYETPHVDRLAATATRFRRGYANCAVCSPSRASLLTGQYPARHGITDWIGARTDTAWRAAGRHDRLLPAGYVDHLDPALETLPEALKAAGYATFFAGKWHLGGAEQQSLPTDHGFDVNVGGYHRGGPYSGGFFSPFGNPYLTDRPEERGMSLPQKLANETSAFIRAHRDTQFLAYLSFYAVHAPIQTTRERWAKYRDKAEHMGIDSQGFRMERILPIRLRQDNPVYAGLIEEMDEAVGSVLATLEETGLAERTIVVFTSDNGGVASGDNYSTTSLPLRGGKGYQWEGGSRVPLFVRVPGLAGGTTSTPAMGMDLYPTLRELAGLPPPAANAIDGRSLVPVLRGDTLAARPLFWHYPHYGNQGGEPHSAVLFADWKLIHYWEDGRDELYRVTDDGYEEEDLAAREPERTADLRRRLDDWLDRHGARRPRPDSTFDARARDAVMARYREQYLPDLEAQRAAMLRPDWEPNPDWWGSEVDR